MVLDNIISVRVNLHVVITVCHALRVAVGGKVVVEGCHDEVDEGVGKGEGSRLH